MAVCGDNQVGIRCDFRGGDDFRIGLHDDLDSGGLGCRRQPVFAVVNHDSDNVDAALAQHIEGRHAEMAGADEGDSHRLRPWLVRPICR